MDNHNSTNQDVDDRLNDIVYVTYNLRLKSRKEKEKRKQRVQFDPIDHESISMVDFWVMEEVVEREPDLPSNVEDLLRDLDIDLSGGDGGTTSTFHATSLDSSQDGGLDAQDDLNLQSLFADFDD
ncbi:hypothetical protein PIB30_054683 [Stylosanthes scabra]|uniref:Uncharacterized protein n=1 Tax=Stylosanthes scabra TaxID=79078 RepID=A0ABU6TIM3_9FABA|nr:hypothetical protein [Stylosanthes scabra]